MSAGIFWNSVRKDERIARPWTIQFVLLGALPCLWPLLSPADQVRASAWLGFLVLLQQSIGVVAVARLIQSDFPWDVRGFLRTRPLQSAQILAPKLAVLALCFVVPAGLLQVLSFFAMGFRLGPVDSLLAAADYSLLTVTILSLALLPALLVRQIGYFMLISLATALAVIISFTIIAFNGISAGFMEAAYPTPESARLLTASRGIIAQAGIAAGFCLAAWVCVSSRSRLRGGAAAMLSALAALALWNFWPINFAAALAGPSLTAPRNEWPDPSQLRWTWQQGKDASAPLRFINSASDGTAYRGVASTLSVDGLDAGWDAQARWNEALLTLGNGQEYRQREYHPIDVNPSPLIAQWKNTPAPRTRFFPGIDLIRLREDTVQQAPDNARLSGRVEMEFLRPELLAKLPVRKGVTFSAGRMRCTIVDTSLSDGRLRVWMSIGGIQLRFRGESDGAWDENTCLLWNPTTLHAAKQDDHGSQRYANGTFWFRTDYASYRIPKGTEASWSDSAELRILANKRGGSVAVPFDFQPVNFPKRQ